MHAWSEVEHDLAYKPTSGQLSVEELTILDELNGLVLAGELGLENLQRAIQRRVGGGDKTFLDRYDLFDYLYVKMNQASRALPAPEVGALRMAYANEPAVLFRFLREAGFDRPEKIEPFLQGVRPSKFERPIAVQLRDAILARHPEYVERYKQLEAHVQDRASRMALASEEGGGSVQIVEPVWHEGMERG